MIFLLHYSFFDFYFVKRKTQLVKLSGREVFTHTVEVTSPCVLKWQFSTKSGDIRFSATFSSSKQEEIDRAEYSESVERSIDAQPGTYTFTWENPARMSKRELLFRVDKLQARDEESKESS